MASYNMYCKDEHVLGNKYDILRTIPGITHVVKERPGHQHPFMPLSVTFTTDVYTDYGLWNVLKEYNVIDETMDGIVLLRKLCGSQILM